MKMQMKCWWWWCSQQRHALQLWGEHVAPLLEKLSLRFGDNSTSTTSKHSTSTFCNRKVTIQLKNFGWNQIYIWPRPPQSSDNAIFDSAIMKNIHVHQLLPARDSLGIFITLPPIPWRSVWVPYSKFVLIERDIIYWNSPLWPCFLLQIFTLDKQYALYWKYGLITFNQNHLNSALSIN